MTIMYVYYICVVNIYIIWLSFAWGKDMQQNKFHLVQEVIKN